MEIREEKEWENVQQFNTGPPMTILQAKLLALLGQAHDMFSRIFQIRIYEFFPPNRRRKNTPFLTNEKFVFVFI